MSIIKHVTLQKIVAHDFRYDLRSFRVFHMMCIRCVMKDVLTKLVKLIKFVFGSRLVSSAAVHLVGIFIYP